MFRSKLVFTYRSPLLVVHKIDLKNQNTFETSDTSKFFTNFKVSFMVHKTEITF